MLSVNYKIENLILKEYNDKIVREEIQYLYSITKSFKNEKDSSILLMIFMNYLIFLTLEATDYIANIKLDFNYKVELKRCRAKIKPYELNIEKILNKIDGSNKGFMNYFSNNLNYFKKKIFRKLITNFGVYKYKNKIIGNTFLIVSDLKYIILKNNIINTEKIRNSSAVIAELLNLIMEIFQNNKNFDCKTNISYKITKEDYDVSKQNNNILKDNIDLNIALFLLDNLSILNFCKLILLNSDICDSLKYRMAYISFYRTYHNLLKLFEKEINCKFKRINLICKNYSLLDERTFRNGMCHYNIIDKLEENEIIKDELYYGLISKYLKINDSEFKTFLINYFDELSLEIEKVILK